MADYDEIWNQKKSDILNGIDRLLEEGTVEKETLEVMKVLLEKAKVKRSMEEFMDDQLEED